MMNSWKLPTSVHCAGVDWQIETDFRVVLSVLMAFDNPNYDKEEKLLFMLMSMIKDFDNLPEIAYMDASEELNKFIDMGLDEDENKIHPRVMDWEQDAPMIIPAINKVVGHEIRCDAYVHWWTFLSAYMEIGECSFSHIIHIRTKKAKHKKLEKWEEEYLKENRNLVELKKRYSEEEKEEQDALTNLLG